MDELIMDAARALGIAQYLSISPSSRSGERTVTLSVDDHTATRELWPHPLMDVLELKKLLLEMFEEATHLAVNGSAG